MANGPHPVEIRLQKRTRVLSVGFDDGSEFQMAAEYLRVFSPSAEVQGHGGGESLLVDGKSGVAIDRIEPVGRYAIRLVFDDGHDTGLFTWPILYDLGTRFESNWQRYLTRLEEAGLSRDPADANDGSRKQRE
jgi:DUF971 family protein